MSFLGNLASFETFNLKDMLKAVKKDPERLLLGAADPLSSKVWGKALGKKYEPIVDQMGGAYGGHTISAFGKNDGGVYKRAQEAGIDTKAGSQMQDLAHVVSAIYGGQGLGNLAGNLMPAQGGGQGLGVFGNGGQAGMQGVGGGNAGALAQSGAISNGAGTASVPGMGQLQQLQKMMPQAQGMPPQQQPQQQSFGQKLMGGLGRVRDSLTPIDPRAEAEMDPAYVKQMRNNAMLKMGLGMMAAANQGGRFGESLAAGLGQAQGGFNKDIEGTYQRGVEARQERRADARLDLADKRYETQEQRALEDRDYRRQRDEIEDRRFDISRDDKLTWQQKQLELENAQLDLARLKASQEKGAPNYRDIDRMRSEYNKRAQKVQDSGNFAEQIAMLAANPNIQNDPSAQTALVFAFGKMLDPESVVREAEYSILEKSRGLKEQVESILPKLQTGARLTPEQIVRMRDVATQFAGKNRERIDALNQYYGELSKRRNIDPFEVTGQGSMGGLGQTPPSGQGWSIRPKQ